MSVKWKIAEKLNKAGYDMISALEIADKAIREFLASGKNEQDFGIMAGKKCVEVVKLKKRSS